MTNLLAQRIREKFVDEFDKVYLLSMIKEMSKVAGKAGRYSDTEIYSMRHGLKVYIVYTKNEEVMDIKCIDFY